MSSETSDQDRGQEEHIEENLTVVPASTSDSLTDIPQEIQNALQLAPPEVRRRIEAAFGFMMSQSGDQGDRAVEKLIDKMESGHIKLFLESMERDADREARDAQASRWFSLVYVLVPISVFLFLVIFLVSQPDLLTEILKILVLLGGGFGAGYGVKTMRDSRPNP